MPTAVPTTYSYNYETLAPTPAPTMCRVICTGDTECEEGEYCDFAEKEEADTRRRGRRLRFGAYYVGCCRPVTD